MAPFQFIVLSLMAAGVVAAPPYCNLDVDELWDIQPVPGLRLLQAHVFTRHGDRQVASGPCWPADAQALRCDAHELSTPDVGEPRQAEPAFFRRQRLCTPPPR
jgi:hypothetical protein